MNKHLIRLFTEKSSVRSVYRCGNEFYEVPVFYKVDFCTEHYPHLSKFQKEGAHSVETELSVVRVKLLKSKTDPLLVCAMAEAVVATDLFQLQGGNIFNLKVAKAPKGDCCILFSQVAARDLVKNPMHPEYRANKWRPFDPIAAYFYGATLEHCSMPFSQSDLLQASSRIDQYPSIRPKAVLNRLLVDAEIGRVMITHRTIQEYLAAPINKKLVQQSGQEFKRVYETVRCLVEKPMEEVKETNSHRVRLNRKEPTAETMCINRGPVVFVDFKPVNCLAYDYFVLGFRFLQSREKYQELEKAGYTYCAAG